MMKLQPAHGLFALMCLIWGATWIAMKAGVSSVPPVFFAGTRFILAGGLTLLFLALSGRKMFPDRALLPRFIGVTILIVCLTYWLLFWGTQHVSSGLAAVLNLAFVPVALIMVGAALGEEMFSARRAAAIGLGILGLLVLFGPKIAHAEPGGALELWGAAAVVASAFTYGAGSVLARPLLRKTSPLVLTAFTTLWGGLAMTIIALAAEPGAREALDGRWGMEAWAGWIFLVVGGSLMGFTIYMKLIRDWGASRAGSYAFVSPVVAVLLGVAIFGETVGMVEAVGMAVMLIAAGLALQPAPAQSAAAE